MHESYVHDMQSIRQNNSYNFVQKSKYAQDYKRSYLGAIMTILTTFPLTNQQNDEGRKWRALEGDRKGFQGLKLKGSERKLRRAALAKKIKQNRYWPSLSYIDF